MSCYKKIRKWLFRASFRTSDGYLLELDEENKVWTDGDFSFPIDDGGFPVCRGGERIEGEVVYPLWFHFFIPFYAIQYYLRGLKDYIRYQYHFLMARRASRREDMDETIKHTKKAMDLLNKL